MNDVRGEVLLAQGPACAMPGCTQPWAQLAHVQPSGMGGRPSTYTASNLAGLCVPCHDIFDGRQLAGRQEMLRRLMASHLHHTRRRVTV